MPTDRTEFYRRLPDAEASKVNDVPRDKAIRLYRTSAHDQTWSLQVRAPVVLGRSKEGKDFIVSSATLNKSDLIALRDAANLLLAECKD